MAEPAPFGRTLYSSARVLLSAKSAAVASYGASTLSKPKESHAAWNFSRSSFLRSSSFWYDCTVAVLPLPNLAAENCWYVSRGHVFCFFSCVATIVACGLWLALQNLKLVAAHSLVRSVEFHGEKLRRLC